MLNRVIELALQYRVLIAALALAAMVVGAIVAQTLPIDVLPGLTRPRVVVVTECHGMAPEEVEQLVTIPLESSLNGASGVTAVRTTSDIGFSLIQVEFEWGEDIYLARQKVQERLTAGIVELPTGVHPQLGPVSSLLGQIMMIGMWSADGETDPLELRTFADWTVRKRLQAIPGVAQVITIGGGRKQYQVLVDLHKLHQHEVSLQEIEQALYDSNLNVTGGYVESDARELLVRGLGRLKSAEDIKSVTVRRHRVRPVLVRDVAQVREAAQIKRGDGSVNGQPAVVITIQKQPTADTRELTRRILEAVGQLRQGLPEGVVLQPTYEQRDFINYGVTNVIESIRDGAILVVIVLFVFLMNTRTTLITLTAIPLSLAVTAMVFYFLEMSINVMTLGGVAVAIGELVDDAIVDVENIFRRLRQNATAAIKRPVLEIVYTASVEVRSAIFVSTVLVIVVFAPLFALSGMEGRLFVPLGIAYIVSILASTVVSLTVTPVLSSWLLPKIAMARAEPGRVLKGLQRCVAPMVRLSLTRTGFSTILSVTVAAIAISSWAVTRLGADFMPAFDEGAVQVNIYTPPGTSLQASRQVSQMADRIFSRLLKSPEQPGNPLLWFTCRTGRAEQDEHVMGVNVSEYVMTLNPVSEFNRAELIEYLHHMLEDLPGVSVEIEQPIAHLISHMLSGVTAQIAVKIAGDDLDVLRAKGEEIRDVIAGVPGIAPPFLEQQQVVSQFRIELLRDRLAYYGMSARHVNEFVETAMNGHVVTQLIDGQRSFDVLVRLAEPYRTDLENLGRIPLELPDGRRIALSDVAHLYEGGGPTAIQRENGRRRIVVRVNTEGRDLGGAVQAISTRVAETVELPTGYLVSYGGQYEAQQEATRRIVLLSLVSLCVTFVVLYTSFPSVSIVLQILFALPTAFVGGVWALYVTDQTLSVAALVGFISLGGIAARNGLLLVSTYQVEIAKSGFSKEVIVFGSLERMAPVLMTALTTGLGLLPLVVGGHAPGREILFPVATVIIGGLISSTVCEFLVRPGLFWICAVDQEQDGARRDLEDHPRAGS